VTTPTRTTIVEACLATAVPAGVTVVLEAGTVVDVVQWRGDSVTVRSPSGTLARVEGPAIEALGLPDGPAAATGPSGTGEERRVAIAGSRFTMDHVHDALRTVYDPEIPIDIVELGLVYRCDEEEVAGGRKISIDLSMTSPGCGMGDVLRGDAERVVARIPGVDEVEVNLVWDPPWGFDRMSDAARLELGLL
jgi:probable FeS assembly SUF system protein SufT